ncbi:hypothetical protein C8R44DRAFT_753953 [Mycena epipterygia]|nr:hypothetical protein C8R44DRAFT_753953 [Mycena epipterygia]
MYKSGIDNVKGEPVAGVQGGAVPDVASTSSWRESDVNAPPPDSGDPQASPSLSGWCTSPSQWRWKSDLRSGPEQGAPNWSILLRSDQSLQQKIGPEQWEDRKSQYKPADNSFTN